MKLPSFVSKYLREGRSILIIHYNIRILFIIAVLRSLRIQPIKTDFPNVIVVNLERSIVYN